jgi:uncharacterized pyridoxamine 5'-phosphate oxidase family protein
MFGANIRKIDDFCLPLPKFLICFRKMKKVLFTFAALIALAACGNKQTSAPETESSGVKNEVVTNDTISTEMKETNMQEVQAYLKECRAFFIATTDGDQPHVRPFGVSEIIDGRLYIMTGKVKDVYKQIDKNGKFEICALKPSCSEWMRLSGTLVNDETLAVKEEFLKRNKILKSMYKADDDNMAVLQITNATARFCSFAAPERKVNF